MPSGRTDRCAGGFGRPAGGNPLNRRGARQARRVRSAEGQNHLTDAYIQVKAQFIVALEDTPPEVDTVSIVPDEVRRMFDATFGPAKGVVRGRFPGGSVLTLTGPGADEVTLRQDMTRM
jgi:hypothetical protein